METKTQFLPDTLASKSCVLDANELMQVLKHNPYIYFSWGVRQLVINDKNDTRYLRLKVDARHFKGYVYIYLSWADLFDVYLVDFDGFLVESVEGLFFDRLVEAIDRRIEFVPSYKY